MQHLLACCLLCYLSHLFYVCLSIISVYILVASVYMILHEMETKMLCHSAGSNSPLKIPHDANCISNGSQRMHNLSGQIIHMLRFFRYRWRCCCFRCRHRRSTIVVTVVTAVTADFTVLRDLDWLLVCLYSRHTRAMCMEARYCERNVCFVWIWHCVCLCVCTCINMYISLWPTKNVT